MSTLSTHTLHVARLLLHYHDNTLANHVEGYWWLFWATLELWLDQVGIAFRWPYEAETRPDAAGLEPAVALWSCHNSFALALALKKGRHWWWVIDWLWSVHTSKVLLREGRRLQPDRRGRCGSRSGVLPQQIPKVSLQLTPNCFAHNSFFLGKGCQCSTMECLMEHLLVLLI